MSREIDPQGGQTKGIERSAAAPSATGDAWSSIAADHYAPGVQLAASQRERPTPMDGLIQPLPILEPPDSGGTDDDSGDFTLRLNGSLGNGGRMVPRRRS